MCVRGCQWAQFPSKITKNVQRALGVPTNELIHHGLAMTNPLVDAAGEIPDIPESVSFQQGVSYSGAVTRLAVDHHLMILIDLVKILLKRTDKNIFGALDVPALVLSGAAQIKHLCMICLKDLFEISERDHISF